MGTCTLQVNLVFKANSSLPAAGTVSWSDKSGNHSMAVNQPAVYPYWTTVTLDLPDGHSTVSMTAVGANGGAQVSMSVGCGQQVVFELPAGTSGTGTGATQTGTCLIAMAVLGESSSEIAGLRKARDEAILSDPIARDFFHVFWSRYYEWSPGVARIAAADEKVATHIRWGFLEPWLGWLELVSLIGQRDISALTDEERNDLLEHLGTRRDSWLAELPALFEGKRPSAAEDVFAAFERFRCAALHAFSEGGIDSDKGSLGGLGTGSGRKEP